MLTHDRLLEVLRYDHRTGEFSWRGGYRRGATKGKTGSRAGGKYLIIRIDGDLYPGHSLAWFYVHKVWPNQLDHKDQDGFNNKISNLRPADNSENGANKTKRRDNTTGFKGVTLVDGKYFVAQLRWRGMYYYLGLHPTAQQAHAAYCAKSKELHGEFHRP